MRKGVLVSTVVFLVISVVALSYAEIPKLINYQGHLTDKGGNPLTGTYSITFTIYDAETYGSSQWTETQSTVDVKNGLFSVLLGSATGGGIPESVFDSPDRWLGVAIEGDDEVGPRQQLVSVPYAYKAGAADAISNGGFISSSQQANGTTDISTSSTSFVDMANMTIPVVVGTDEKVLIFFSTNIWGNISWPKFRLMRDSTVLIKSEDYLNSTTPLHCGLQYLDTPSAGSYTYKIQWKTGDFPIANNASSMDEHRNLIILKLK